MKKRTHPIPICRPRTVPMAQEPPDYGFTGIPRRQVHIRHLIENGASREQVKAARHELLKALESNLTNGSLSAQAVSDEAATCVDMGPPQDAATLTFHRHCLDLAGVSREEVAEADRLIKREVERLTRDLPRSPRYKRIAMKHELYLLRACQAKSTLDRNRKLDFARQSINEAYECDRDAWIAYLYVLLVALLLRGEFEMVRALRHYLASHKARSSSHDPSLIPALWRRASRRG